MKWALAGLTFALAVGMAVFTAALRADNARARHRVELAYREVWDRISEYRRLTVEKLAQATPERLAAAHWSHLHRAAARGQRGEP